MWLISFLLKYKDILIVLQSQFSDDVILHIEWSVSLCILRCDAQSKQLVSSLNQHGDLVAAADGLIDLFGGAHLCSVYLHHDVSWNHARSKTNAVVLNLVSAAPWKGHRPLPQWVSLLTCGPESPWSLCESGRRASPLGRMDLSASALRWCCGRRKGIHRVLNWYLHLKCCNMWTNSTPYLGVSVSIITPM